MQIAKKDSDIFNIIDKEDEKQIMSIEQFGDDKRLVYQVRDRLELSYLGIKHLTLVMAQNNNPLETLVESKVDLIGESKEKTWYATVRVLNKNTGQITEGVAQCNYYDEKGFTDNFGRTKAHSKAERNALRKQIPEAYITKLIQNAKASGQAHKIG